MSLTNLLEIRQFILNEVLSKKSVEEGYKNLCEALGDDKYDYVDYEYHYYKYYQGDRDLEHERSTDSKPKTFADLPIEVLEPIVGELKIKDRMSTRKVCHRLRDIVDDQKKTFIMNLQIWIRRPTTIEIFTSNNSISYKKIGENCQVDNERTPPKLIENANHVDIALNDLAIWLKAPNVEIGRIELLFEIPVENFDERLLELFQNIPKLSTHVVHFRIASYELGVSLLSCFRPGTLRYVILIVQVGNIRGEEVRMLEMEQFKQAEGFTVDKNVIVFDPIHLHRFLHLKRFSFKCSSFDVENIVFLRNTLPTIAIFEQGEVVWNRPLNVSAVGRALGADVNRERVDYNYPIPNSNFHLNIIVERCWVVIRREKNT